MRRLDGRRPRSTGRRGAVALAAPLPCAALSVAIIAAATYVLMLVAVPFVDPSIDVLRAHPEEYAAGPAGPLVVASYVAFAVVFVGIGSAVLFARDTPLRIGSVLLFAGAATSVAVSVTLRPIEGGVLALGVLALAIAPLVVSLASGWAGGVSSGPALALAVAVTLGAAGLFVSPPEVAGMANRIFDLLLGLWSAAFALGALRRSGRLAAQGG